MVDVFLSYARSTEAEAVRVAQALAALEYQVWRDDQLPAHRPYAEVIEARLQAAKAVVVLWSSEAVRSQWVRSEADRARVLNKLVQINIDGAPLPMPFDQIHCADLRGWRGEPDFPPWRQALNGLAALMAPGPSPEKAPPARSGTPGSLDKPSIAVLPFANLSREPEQDYFVDGLMEELAGSLSHIRTLFVIAAGSSLSLKGQDLAPLEAARRLGVRYVLEGSVRRAGEKVRIAVKLIDASVASPIWAERFEDRLDDIFALQDKVALGVAGAIEFSVQHAETLRSIRRPTSDLRGYDAYLRAVLLFRTYRKEDMLQALELLERAIELDPDYGLALSLAACCHALILRFGWTGDPAAHRRRFNERAERSIRVGSDDAQVLATVAQGYWASGRVEEAAPLAARAAQLNPCSSLPLLARGQICVATGDLDAAEDCLVRSMQLDPLSPNRNLQLGALAAVRLAQGRFAEAADLAREWTQISNQPTAFGFLVSALGHLGDVAAARAAMGRLRSLSPIAMEEMAAVIYRQDGHRQRFLQGIALAAVEEPAPPSQAAVAAASAV